MRYSFAQQTSVIAILVVVATLYLEATSAQSVDCDFNAGSLCSWVIDSKDQLQIQLMQEEQPPPELKTSGAFDADYIYVTMGQVAKTRRRARMRIISPFFETATYEQNSRLPSTRCFSFWYRAASWKRSTSASFTFNHQNGEEFFSLDLNNENANVWRFKQIDLMLRTATDQIQILIDSGDTYFSYVAFDHFQLSTKSCDESAHVVDRYKMLGGNCPGHYLAQFSEPIGCFKCSLAECLQTCEAYAFCRGVSWVDRNELNEVFPGNSQCFLKAASCWPQIAKFSGGYKYYERISGFTLSNNSSQIGQDGQFQILSAVNGDSTSLAPETDLSGADSGKWIPRNAKEGSEFEHIIRWEKPKTVPPQLEKKTPGWLTTGEYLHKQQTGQALKSSELAYEPTGQPFIIRSEEPTTIETSSSSSLPATTTETLSTTSRYTLLPSPFPNSKHVFGYVPLQPFGNCGGHFIIDDNHQYLGCTRCSFAQCATLCSLSEQCRGFSFTESILVAKQCYLKTALSCEPQPSSTGFKYFIKIRKSSEDQVAEASHGRNGIGAFTIKPVMPKQTPNSEQESRESSRKPTVNDEASATQSWMQTDWSGRRYVSLDGNCAGAFLRDGSGEAVTCPRCSLAACQKLCDQDDECRGVSYSNDPLVAVQCYLKTVDTCNPISQNSGYTFHVKKD